MMPESPKCHCYFKEEKIPGQGGCFLSLPGPMKTCEAYTPPTQLNPAPLDAAMAGKFERFGK
jgi:hypothetical protein